MFYFYSEPNVISRFIIYSIEISGLVCSGEQSLEETFCAIERFNLNFSSCYLRIFALKSMKGRRFAVEAQRRVGPRRAVLPTYSCRRH